MDKRGLIGKIFLILGIIILIIGIILGITAYQIYSVYKTVQKEQIGLEQDVKALSEQRDCSKADSIQTRFQNIKNEATSACKNPIIKIGVKKFMADKPMNISGQNIAITCENLNILYEEITTQFKPIKDLCTNLSNNGQQTDITLISAPKIPASKPSS